MGSDIKSAEKLEKILCELYREAKLSSPEKCAKKAVEYMKNNKSPLSKELDISVRAVKGGTYKIKSYYLENNDLMDIRGASTLISTVQDVYVPDCLKKVLGYDSIVYNGGGNLFALVPSDKDWSLADKLEECAHDVLITANSAYYISEPLKLSEILGEKYKDTMKRIETGLEELKKSKIVCDTEPETTMMGEKLIGESKVNARMNPEKGSYCEKCRKRIAKYALPRADEHIPVCGGCLHKFVAGKAQRSGFITEFNKMTGRHAVPQASLANIDKDDIAVVYADGNNMGGIIMNITDISQMMDFSGFVKEQMKQIVYASLDECDIMKFEIVAMGGDDLFMIIPAKGALEFAAKLVEKYEKAFREEFPDSSSTLSVGIAFAKPNTPVKVALESAEDELKRAKKLVRENGGKGSVSFNVLQTYEGSVVKRGMTTLTPYSLEALDGILGFAEKIKSMNNYNTRLQNLLTAFLGMEDKEEAELFFEYTNAKLKPKEKQKNVIILPELDGYRLDGAFYIRNGSYENGCSAFIWKDLLKVIEFYKGGRSGESLLSD